MNGQPESNNKLWLEAWPNRLTPLVDLICLPGAGAGASTFRSWHRSLPGFFALYAGQLPGRENRIDEAAETDLAQVVQHLTSSYLGHHSTSRPLIIFGHSMGGVIAFELARELRRRDCPVSGLVMSATTPPRPNVHSSTLSEPMLKRMLLAYDVDNQSMVANDELFASLAPVLRSDFQLLRSHVIDPSCSLPDVDTHLLSGNGDPVVAFEAVAKWRVHFDGPVSHHRYDGGHHFPFKETEPQILALLTKLARRALGKRG
ncbi:MAG: alpha/beta fold hydrolase [Rhizobiaceae bacterium]